jgi:hypothetical protein
MRLKLVQAAVVSLGLVGIASMPTRTQAAGSGPTEGSWYFGISGDSRDCGDVVMPRIAALITKNNPQKPISFYWHLGDFRRMYEPDCDMLKRADPAAICSSPRPVGELGSNMMHDYLEKAWPDFIEKQIKPFGNTPVFLTAGNHELYGGRRPDDYRLAFQRWLTQEPIHSQRGADYPDGGEEGDTYYHFVFKGVDFISLDNSSGSFGKQQIKWLDQLLKRNLTKDDILTIVVGMHAALPGSSNSFHAMDAKCASRCDGNAVYDLLAKVDKSKKVYVFASHSHRFADKVFAKHSGRVLDGWIVGTAGAEQYLSKGSSEWPNIRYGYLEVEVTPKGEISPHFQEVMRNSPAASGETEPAELLDFCFSLNWRNPKPDKVDPPCKCPKQP